MGRSSGTICLALLFFLSLLGCKKYEAPYDTKPRPIDLDELAGYLGKAAGQVRDELSRTLLMVDYTSPVTDSVGQVVGSGMTTLFAYDNARPGWAQEEFTTFVLTDTAQRVVLALAQRDGIEKDRNLYLWELWSGYVLPFLGDGDWFTGIYSEAENTEGVHFDRREAATAEQMRSACEEFMAYYRGSSAFKRLHFALYATDGKRLVQVVVTLYTHRQRSLYVHRMEIALSE